MHAMIHAMMKRGKGDRKEGLTCIFRSLSSSSASCQPANLLIKCQSENWDLLKYLNIMYLQDR
jgi:hypothetical protein